MKKIIIPFVIISLFAFNAFTLVRFKNLKQHIVKNKVIVNYKKKIKDDELNAYKVSFKANLLSSNIQLDRLMIKDSLNKIIRPKEIFNAGQKQILVYRFSKMHCESCVVASIKIIRKWMDSIGSENIIFLGNYRNNKIFRKTISEYDIENLKFYNTSQFNMAVEEIGYPYFFMLDKNLKTSNVFVPDKGLPKITEEYLKIIFDITTL
jgi:hypothetical protein